MRIAIEGMDGAGKTTISRHIEKAFGFICIEKPTKYMFLTSTGKIDYVAFYSKLKEVYGSSDDVRSRFFGQGNYIASNMFLDNNVVYDRHLASNYYWNGTKKQKRYFDELVRVCGKPDITLFLYASPTERYKRLQKRNAKDIDLKDPKVFDDGTYKHIEFLNRYNFNYELIDTNDKTIAQVCREVDNIIKRMLYGRGYIYEKHGRL